MERAIFLVDLCLYLAMEKEDMMQRIRFRDKPRLDRQSLLREIKLKENELQKLLTGINSQEFQAPSTGVWKIQSQKLDGKPIPKHKWIQPQMGPDVRFVNIYLK